MPNPKRYTHLLELTQARLKELLSYDPDTGVFAWKERRENKNTAAGVVAGSLHVRGYVVIDVDQKNFRAHRLAWFYVHGTWPTGQIDHRNGKRADNRIDNLRVVDNSVNQQNKKRARSDSKTGIIGVHLHVSGRYQAKINIAGKSKSLGMFDTAVAAQDAYLTSKRQLHAGCTI